MNTEAIKKRLFSLPDASVYLGDISVFSLRRYIKNGLLKAVYVGGRVMIPATELERIEQFGLRRNGGQ